MSTSRINFYVIIVIIVIIVNIVNTPSTGFNDKWLLYIEELVLFYVERFLTADCRHQESNSVLLAGC